VFNRFRSAGLVGYFLALSLCFVRLIFAPYLMLVCFCLLLTFGGSPAFPSFLVFLVSATRVNNPAFPFSSHAQSRLLISLNLSAFLVSVRFSFQSFFFMLPMLIARFFLLYWSLFARLASPLYAPQNPQTSSLRTQKNINKPITNLAFLPRFISL